MVEDHGRRAIGSGMAVPPKIRLARLGEFHAVGEITVRAYAHDGFVAASDGYAARLRDAADRAAGAELWVAVDAESELLLGSVTFCPLGSPYRELATDAEGEFRMLAVDPAARRRGVGRGLVRHCLDHSQALGLDSVVVCSLPTMTAAHALYLSEGFSRDHSLDWTPTPGVDLLGFRYSGPQPA
jgi:ribosomal protein S18 acetylase RimI-like enzyme